MTVLPRGSTHAHVDVVDAVEQGDLRQVDADAVLSRRQVDRRTLGVAATDQEARCA